MPYTAQADTTAHVHITATGIVIAAPTGFTVSYVTDFETHLAWVNPPNSINTMIRAAYGHEPTSMTDGYLVYQGAGTSFNDTSASLTSPDIIYYKAWSQRNDGIWGTLYAEADTEDLMSLSFLFIGTILLMAAAFVFKDKGGRWLFYLDAFAWAITGFFCFSSQTSLISVVHSLGILCMLAVFGCILMPVILRTKKAPPSVAKPMTTAESLDYYRKIRYGGRRGYDANGHRSF
jgi:hypothetical protein